MSARVLVAGAGISGLAAAWDLMRAGVDVTVIEATGEAGGVVGSWDVDGYSFENGPAAVQGNALAFRSLVQDLGLEDQVVTASADHRERHLYYKGSMKKLPRTFRDFFASKLFTAGQKTRAVMEPWVRAGRPDREETVAEFFGRRVGRGVTMTWVDVIVSGVYAGNPNRLGIRSAFPDLADMEAEHGSILKGMRSRERERRDDAGRVVPSPLWSLRGGLGAAVQKMVADLGDRIRYNCRVTNIVRRPGGGLQVGLTSDTGDEVVEPDRMILAVSAATAGILIAPLAPDAADLLFEVESSPLIVAQAGFDREQLPGLPKGYGYLVPRCTRLRTLGWIFESQLFPERAPEGKVAMCGFLGGILDPHAIDQPDEVTRHLLLGELALALGQRKLPIPEVFRIVRWKNRLPQYNVGHLRRMVAVRRLVEKDVPEVALAGNWIEGITVDACVKRGREAAQESLDALPVA